jgi:hypothetical protein
MNDREKTLLLQLILEDIRGNWAYDLDSRVLMARELAEELSLKAHQDRIDAFEYDDGRHFRTSYLDGGYEGMEVLHGLSQTIADKSPEFQQAAAILTYPEYRFDDWDEYEKAREGSSAAEN